MKNTIDLMAQSLEKHHLKDCIPDNARKKPPVNPSLEIGNGNSLISIYYSHNTWVLDSGATRLIQGIKK
jgi:hypothetical protein